MRALILLLLFVPPIAAEESLEDLVAQLGEGDVAKSRLAYGSLKERAGPKVIPLVLDAIQSWPSTSQYFGVLLLKAYPPGQSNDALRTLTGATAPFLRVRAALALYDRGEQKMLSVVVNALREGDPERDGLEALIWRVKPADRSEVRDFVRSLLTSGRSTKALCVMFRWLIEGKDKCASAEARTLLADNRVGVRMVALTYLVHCGERERAGELATLVREQDLNACMYLTVRYVVWYIGWKRVPEKEILRAFTARCRDVTNAETLWSIVKMLAKAKHRKAIPIFEELLAHEDGKVAVAALEALTNLSAAPDLKTLVRLLGNEKRELSEFAHTALYQRLDPKVIPLVLNSIEAWTSSCQWRGMRVLEAFPPKQSNSAFRKLTKANAPNLRVDAAIVLYKRGEQKEKMLSVALKALPEGDPDENGLLQVLMWVSCDKPEVREVLRPLLTSERSTIAIRSMFDKFLWSEYGGATAEARALLDDERAEVRMLALAYLIRFDERKPVSELAALIREQDLDAGRSVWLVTLMIGKGRMGRGRVPEEELLEAFTERCRNVSGVSTLVRIIELLGHAKSRKASPILGELLEHKDVKVAKAAMEALTSLCAAPDSEALVRMLEHTDPNRALLAARALRRVDDRRGLEFVLRIVRDRKGAREEAIRVLGEFRSAEGVDLLLDALLDPKSMVRSHAVQGLLATFKKLFPYREVNFQSVGYNSGKPAAQNKDAVKRIRAWWNANREQEW